MQLVLCHICGPTQMKATSNMKKVQPLNLRNQLHHNHLQQPFAATSSTHPVKKKKRYLCPHDLGFVGHSFEPQTFEASGCSGSANISSFKLVNQHVSKLLSQTFFFKAYHPFCFEIDLIDFEEHTERMLFNSFHMIIMNHHSNIAISCKAQTFVKPAGSGTAGGSSLAVTPTTS